MNLIGQKIAQSSRIVSSAHIAAGGKNIQREISNKASQLSNRFIQAASQQAIKGITPGGATFSRMKPTISKLNFLQTNSFSSEAGSTPTSKFNFMEAEEMAPMKRIYTALKDFSSKFDRKGITAKEIDRLGSACYNLQIADNSDEVIVAKSLIHSSLVKFINKMEQTIPVGENASPEETQALNDLTALKNETMQFLANYERV